MQAIPLSIPKRPVFHLILIVVLLLGLVGAAAHRPALGAYIIQGPDLERVEDVVRAHGGNVVARLEIVNGLSAQLSVAAAEDLKKSAGITSVFPDATVQAVNGQPPDNAGRYVQTDYADVVGADYIWQQGITGKGITVAMVDSGLAKYPAFLKDSTGRLDNRIIGWVDLVDGRKAPYDGSGHGTHVAGVIANSQVGADGEWNGIAPDVNLVSVRVLEEDGSSTFSRVIQGIEWVIDHRAEYDIRVLNLSLVGPVLAPYWADPLNQAVTRAWAEGIVVVAAAGNNGPDPLTISVPGNNPYVITVGAFTDNYTPEDWSDDYVTPFSSAGPTLDAFVKPDLVAPGGHIVSTMLPNSYLGKLFHDQRVGSAYYSLAGTSQAAAVVSGIAALILEAHPELTPDQVKYRLQFSAFPWVDPESGEAQYSIWQQGYGRVSAPDAVFKEIDGSANAGMDILADLAGEIHYQGPTAYDEEAGEFLLSGFGAWAGGFGAWAGGFGAWAGGFGAWAGYSTWEALTGTWVGSYNAWTDGFGIWADGFGIWADSFGIWAGSYPIDPDGFGIWADGFGVWAGSYEIGADGFGAWADGFGAWAGSLLPGEWSETAPPVQE
jgi:serine protease AprX